MPAALVASVAVTQESRIATAERPNVMTVEKEV